MKTKLKIVGISIVVIMLALFLFNRNDYNISYESIDSYNLIRTDYMDGIEGHIIEDNRGYLFIGTNINTTYKQLNATYIGQLADGVSKDLISIGTRVKCISNGPTLTSYPGVGGLEIVSIVEDNFNGTSLEKEIVHRAIETLKKINKQDFGLYAINNVVLENDIWTLNVVGHINHDHLRYYTMEIQDGSKEVKNITIFNKK